MKGIIILFILLIIFIVIPTICIALFIDKREQIKREKLEEQARIKQEQKARFQERFNIILPYDIGINMLDKKVDCNHYMLSYPCWCYSNKDGTADKRKKNNRVTWGINILYLENYTLICRNPLHMINLVNELRDNNIIIKQNDIEISKEKALKQNLCGLKNNHSLDNIIERFSSNPTDFENFCAELFKKMGYLTQVTPPTNDGGFDIKIQKDNTTSIVECKCYSQKNKIGRPLIQKLVGANQKELADNMIFITTSDYSKVAIDFANEVGVKLINGQKLIQLLEEFTNKDENSSAEISNKDWYLTKEDLKQYIATDIYYNYL